MVAEQQELISEADLSVEAPIRKKETESRVNLVDIYTEEGIREFGKDLQDSNGNCLVLVHAFDPFFNRDASILDDPKNQELKAYVERLKRIIHKAQSEGETKLPILAMVRTEVGQIRRSDDKINQTKERLQRELQQILGLETDNIFFTVTQQATPIPLLTGEDEKPYLKPSGLPEYKRIMIDFVNRLKDAGLKKVVFAGTNFGGKEDFGVRYDTSEYPPWKGIFAKSDWRLKKYFEKRKRAGDEAAWKHPFELISPEGCVAEAIRSFAYCDVDIGVTQATYPQRMPKTSQLEKRGSMTFKVHPPDQK